MLVDRATPRRSDSLGAARRPAWPKTKFAPAILHDGCAKGIKRVGGTYIRTQGSIKALYKSIAAAAKAPRRPAPVATICAAPPVIGAPVPVGAVTPPVELAVAVPLPVLLPPVVPLFPPTRAKEAQEMRVVLAKWKTKERFPKKLPGPST